MNQTVEDHSSELSEVKSSTDLTCERLTSSLGNPVQPAVSQCKNCLWEDYKSPCQLSTGIVSVNNSNTPSSLKKKSCLWENYDSPSIDNSETSCGTFVLKDTASSSNEISCLSNNLNSSGIDKNKLSTCVETALSSTQKNNHSPQNFNSPNQITDDVNICDTMSSTPQKRGCVWESFISPAIDNNKVSASSITVYESDPSPSNKLKLSNTPGTNEFSIGTDDSSQLTANRSENKSLVENKSKKRKGKQCRGGATKRRKPVTVTQPKNTSKKEKGSHIPPAVTKLDENIGETDLAVNVSNKAQERKSILAETKNLLHCVFPLYGEQLSKCNALDTIKLESSQRNDEGDKFSEENSSSVLLLPEGKNNVSSKDEDIESTVSSPKAEMAATEDHAVACIPPDITPSQVIVVDEEQKMNDDDDLFLMPPVNKSSSKRLRRNSIQLFRKAIELSHENSTIVGKEYEMLIGDGNLPGANNDSQQMPISDIPNAVSNDDSESRPLLMRKHKNPTQPNSGGKSTKARKGKSSVSGGAVPEEAPLSSGSLETSSKLDQPGTNAAPSFGKALSVIVPEDYAPERPRRKCTTQSIQVAPSPGSLVKIKQQLLEDIYFNRLWRSQMPKERPWESIPETPIVNARTGIEALFSARKVRCLVKFEDEPNKTKLRQRRQKAVANGWKPLTKKKMAELEKLLENKLADLDGFTCAD